jgi:hypothetical protein
VFRDSDRKLRLWTGLAGGYRKDLTSNPTLKKGRNPWPSPRKSVQILSYSCDIMRVPEKLFHQQNQGVIDIIPLHIPFSIKGEIHSATKLRYSHHYLVIIAMRKNPLQVH